MPNKTIQKCKNIIALIIFILPTFLSGQWYSDPTINTAVCDTAEDQNFVKIISDENGGAYIVWTDHRDEPGVLDGDIYGQRIHKSGYTMWTKNGISINSETNAQVVPELISDGTGGFIVVWQLKTGLLYDRDIYAQRVDSLGNLLWNPTGIVVTDMGGTSAEHSVISDGNGGAIIAWQNLPGAGGNVNIFAQHIDQNGQSLWVSNGLTICDTVETQSYPVQAMDDNGGSLITWADSRNGFPNNDIYMQHITGNGYISLTNNGIAVCNDSLLQDEPIIQNIGAGYFIVVWEDYRNSSSDLYMQKTDTVGTMYFLPNGIPVCSNPNQQYNAAIIQDGVGGFIVSWTDLRNDGGDIYAQRFDMNGNALWTTDGVVICSANDIQDVSQIVPDNQGGAIISWMDYRTEWQGDVYAQRIDQNGNVIWNPNGVAICTANGEQWGQQMISNGSGGSIIVWDDKRNGIDDNVCAQNINYQGILGLRSQVSNRTNLSKAISDFQTTADTINFVIQNEKLQTDRISTVSVFIDTVFHEADGDLVFTLEHNGVIDTLIKSAGANGNDFFDTILDDSASIPIGNGSPPFNGIYSPYQSLSVFQGLAATGDWILNIYDGVSGNTGTFQAWGIAVTFQENPADIAGEQHPRPVKFVLYQNFPNPFNPITQIKYDLTKASNVRIEVFNSLGQKIETIVNEFQNPGSYTASFDGSQFASGLYFYQIQAGELKQVRKMLLIK